MIISIAMILRTLATVITMPELQKLKAEKWAPVLDTAAALAEVPEATREQRKALMKQVQTWKDEKRGPTDAELDAFKATRDELDVRARAARDALPKG